MPQHTEEERRQDPQDPRFGRFSAGTAVQEEREPDPRFQSFGVAPEREEPEPRRGLLARVRDFFTLEPEELEAEMESLSRAQPGPEAGMPRRAERPEEPEGPEEGEAGFFREAGRALARGAGGLQEAAGGFAQAAAEIIEPEPEISEVIERRQREGPGAMSEAEFAARRRREQREEEGRAVPRETMRETPSAREVRRAAGVPEEELGPALSEEVSVTLDAVGQMAEQAGREFSEQFPRSDSAQQSFLEGGYKNWRWYVATVGEQIPQLGAQFAAAGLTGGSSTVAQLMAFAGPAAVQMSGHAYIESRDAAERTLREQNPDMPQAELEERADEIATGNALVTGLGGSMLEAAGPGAFYLLRRIPGAGTVFSKELATRLLQRGRQIAGDVVRGGLTEGFTEISQEALQVTMEWASGANPEAFRGFLNRGVDAFVAGLLLGGGVSITQNAAAMLMEERPELADEAAVAPWHLAPGTEIVETPEGGFRQEPIAPEPEEEAAVPEEEPELPLPEEVIPPAPEEVGPEEPPGPPPAPEPEPAPAPEEEAAPPEPLPPEPEVPPTEPPVAPPEEGEVPAPETTPEEVTPPSEEIQPPETPPVPEEVIPGVPEAPGEVATPGELAPAPTAVQAPVPMREPLDVATGGETPIKLPSGRELGARFAIVDATTAPTSHNPFTFQVNPDFPEGIQERRYHADPVAQEELQQEVGQFDPTRLLDPTVLATGGPSIIRPDGVRLSGNFRGMLIQRAQQENPEGYRRYLDGMVERAEQFGLDRGVARATIEQILEEGGTPELSRVVTDPETDLVSRESLAELMSAFNDQPTRARDPLGEAQTRARRMREAREALTHFQDTVEADQTLRDYLNTSSGRSFVQSLVSSGVITRQEAARFIDRRTGTVNDEGKTLIERTMLAAAVGDPEVIDRAPKGWLRQIEKAVPAIITAQRFEGWDVSAVLAEALEMGAAARAAGLPVQDLAAQTDLLEGAEAQRTPAQEAYAELERELIERWKFTQGEAEGTIATFIRTGSEGLFRETTRPLARRLAEAMREEGNAPGTVNELFGLGNLNRAPAAEPEARFSEEAAVLARFLQDNGQRATSDAFRGFARDAEFAFDQNQTQDLFGFEPPTPLESFVAHFVPEADQTTVTGLTSVQERGSIYEAIRRKIAGLISPELRREAEEDPLTGLPNVRTDVRRGERILERRRKKQEGETQVVRFRVDLDNFKALNDRRGHGEGDRALRIVADILRQSTRPGDQVVGKALDPDVASPARVGGDEFALTVELPAASSPARMRDRLEAEISRALDLAGLTDLGDRRVGASIGFAVAEPGATLEELDAAADIAALERKEFLDRSRPREGEGEGEGPLEVREELGPDDWQEHTEAVFGSEEEAILVSEKIDQLSLDFASHGDFPAGDLSVKARLARIAAHEGKRSWTDTRGQMIQGPQDLHRLLHGFRDPSMEHWHVLFQDDTGKIVAHEGYTSGAINYVAFGETFMDGVARRAKELGVTNVIFGHNHPSGDPQPSMADKRLTAQAAALFEREGISLKGHYVIDHQQGFFMRAIDAGGETAFPAVDGKLVVGQRVQLEGAEEFQGPDWTDAVGPKITKPWHIVDVALPGLPTPDQFHVVWVDSRFQVIAHELHHRGAADDFGGWFADRRRNVGAYGAFLVTDDGRAPEAEQGLLGELVTKGSAAGILNHAQGVIDIIDLGISSEGPTTVVSAYADHQLRQMWAPPHEPTVIARKEFEALPDAVKHYTAMVQDETPSYEPRTPMAPREGPTSSDPSHEGGGSIRQALSATKPWQRSLREFAGEPPDPGHAIYPTWVVLRDRWRQSTLEAISEGKIDPRDVDPEELPIRDLDRVEPLPEGPLYHVTTNVQGVLQMGLKTRAQLGLWEGRGLGGGAENTVSVTTSRDMAERIRDAMFLARRVASGELTLEELTRQAREGERADQPWIADMSRWFDRDGEPKRFLELLLEEKRSVPVSMASPQTAEELAARGLEPDPQHVVEGRAGVKRYFRALETLAGEELARARFEFFRDWLASRDVNGGPLNPFFTQVDVPYFASMRESDIAIVEGRPVEGAQGVQWSELNEWRIWSGAAVEIRRIDGAPLSVVREDPDAYRAGWAEQRIARVARGLGSVPSTRDVAGLASRRQLEDVTEYNLEDTERDLPRRSEIIKDLEDAIGAPIRVGRHRRLARAHGFYRPGPEDVRIRTANDIDVVAHEVGHHLHKLLFGATPPPTSLFPSGRGKIAPGTNITDAPLEPWKSVLEPLARTSDKSLAEGWAEFWRLWLTNPEVVEDSARPLVEYLAERMSAEYPGVWAGLQRFQSSVATYAAGSPVGRVAAHIAPSTSRRGPFSPLKGFRRLYDGIIDDFGPLRRMDRELIGDIPPTPEHIEDMAGFLGDLMRGSAGQADHFIRRAPLDYRTMTPRTEIIPFEERLRVLQEEQAGVEDIAPPEPVPLKSLEALLEPVEDALEDFETYATARRARELAGRGIESGLEDADVQRTIEILEEQHPAFGEVFEDLQLYNQALLEFLSDAGVISRRTFFTILLNNREYVPFFRVMDEQGPSTRGGGKGLFGHLFSPVKRIRGSGRDILPPLESIVKNTFLYTRMAARHEVSKTLGDLAQIHGAGKWIRQIHPPVRPTKVFRDEVLKWLVRQEFFDELSEETVETLENLEPEEFEGLFEEFLMVFRPGDLFGKDNVISMIRGERRVWFEVDPDIFRAAMAMPSGVARSKLVRVLQFPAVTLRAGATLALEFQARNPMRDQIMAFTQSEFGFMPGIDLAKGLFHYFGQTDIYWSWKAGGGENAALVDMDRRAMREGVLALQENRVLHVMKHPLMALQGLSAALENATRVAEYQNALRAEGRPMGVTRRILRDLQALVDPELRTELRRREQESDRPTRRVAALASREISVNFSTHGDFAAVEFFRLVSAFWNARLQGYKRLFTAFKRDPVGASMRAFMGITLPSILLYMLNRDEPEYFEIPSWQRRLFWLIKVPNPLAGMIPELLRAAEEDPLLEEIVSPFITEGDSVWLRIPKPFELGVVFGTIPERILEWWDTEDPEGLTSALQQTISDEMANTFLPIPTVVQPLLENYFNYSLFLQRPIDPRAVEDAPPHLRATPSTSDVAKGLAAMLEETGAHRIPGVKRTIGSPNKIDNLIFAWTGGLGRTAIQAMDVAGRVTRATPPEEAPTMADIPGIGGLVARRPGFSAESVERFYEEYNRVAELKAGIDLLTREERFEDLDEIGTPQERAQAEIRFRDMRRTADQLAGIRADARMVERSKALTEIEKTRRLERLGETYRRIAAAAIDRRVPSGSPFPLRPSDRTEERRRQFRRP